MSNRVSFWVGRLGSRPLPVITAVATRLESLLAAPNTDFPHLEAAMWLDPGFCTHVFRTAGKALGQHHEPCVTPAHALSLIGEDALRSAIGKLPPLTEGAQGLRTCYAQAAQAAFFAQRWTTRRNDPHGAEIVLAALFQGLAEMALWSHSPAEMADVRKQEQAGTNRDDAANAVLGCTLDELGLGLARHWSLPRFSCETLETGAHFQARSLSVKLTAELSRTTYLDWHAAQMPELVETLGEYLAIEPAEAQAELHSATAEAARTLHGLGLPLNIYPLISGAPRQRPSPSGSENPQTVTSPAAPTPQRTTTPKPASNSPHDILQHAMQMMREHAGLKRVLFAMLSPDRKQLKARFVLDAASTSPLRGFTAATTGKNIFNLLLGKPQALWINPANQGKFLPLMPEGFRKMADPRGFFAMSLFVNNRSIGLFYADAAPDGALGDQEYAHFRQICQRVAHRMKR